MGFEKRILDIAKKAKVEHAYFAYGTMWAPCAENGDRDVQKLVKLIERDLPGTRVLTNVCGDEIAFDFASWDRVTV